MIVACWSYSDFYDRERNPLSDSSQPQRVTDKTTARPFGVWLFTIWVAVLAGLVPGVVIVLAYSNLETRDALGLTPVHVTLSVLLAGAIIVAAGLAWLGNRVASYAFVVLAVIHYGLIAYNSMCFVNAGLIDDSQKWGVIGRAVRNVIWSGLLIWYFALSRLTDRFYDRGSQLAP
ncbi:MAG: hypothetical protein JWP89_2694 [Schlesneria sp.]|nr:hypothetical protein [Schlesneria sp.]